MPHTLRRGSTRENLWAECIKALKNIRRPSILDWDRRRIGQKAQDLGELLREGGVIMGEELAEWLRLRENLEQRDMRHWRRRDMAKG